MTENNDSSNSSANTNGERGNQSPINIDDFISIPTIYPPIVMSGRVEATTRMTFKNTGHTVEIRPSIDSPGAFLSGGPLKEKYKFLQLHFHWGSTNEMGSEHSINGNFYSMEAHFVHHNPKYENIEASMKKSDGIAVVAIFFELDSKSPNEDNPVISKITNHLPNVKTVGSTIDVASDVLEWIKDYCSNCSQYYTYHGSLTTYPFTENVIWLIYPIPIKISKSQIDLFRQLNSSEGGCLNSNCRPIQLVNGRQIHLVTNTLEPKNGDEDYEGKAELA